MENPRPLKLGMVGGGKDAFIGAVHRMAARLDGEWALTAGALSSTPERAMESARAIGLPRAYGTWEEMLAGELALPPGERVDAVSVVTPNHMHFPVARAFVDAGFSVVCDKPMVLTAAQGRELADLVDARGVSFAVTYNYTGYPLVAEARRLVREGALGEVRKVVVTYTQGWLSTPAEREGSKQAEWRTDPARAGAGALGDIGSHAENLASWITGLALEEVAADVSTFVPGRRVDDDASVLLRFAGGARGALVISQVATGYENDLRIRVHGTTGSLEWAQEEPNRLTLRRQGEPPTVLTRAGGPFLGAEAAAATRLPSGHPEGFIEAFANVYSAVARRLRGEEHLPFPDHRDGLRGVLFIEAALRSSADGGAWTRVE
jgi:predicted dehydrogenase